MTLNKQRILSELGSVVNQLQSADCGCMGKLFGNSTQDMNSMSNEFPQHGSNNHGYHTTPCHGYGYHGPCCGEPYSMNSSQRQRPFCMGQCNAPKMYADTYNFLNENLMQPVVKEVYTDLNNISPANTIMNNEMGNKMGWIQPGLSAQGQVQAMNQNNSNNLNTFNTGNHMQSPQMPHVSQMGQHFPMMQNPQAPVKAQNQQYLRGMGPQIMNMIKGESLINPMQPLQGQGQLAAPMIIDAPQSPHGKVGVMPLSAPMKPNYNSNYPQPHTDNRFNNPNQQQICATTTNTIPNMQQSNPMQQKPMPQQSSYGQHTQGITKFNEMFPGVMQGLGGDLGFDPMAIAIQMNPANHHQVAMNTMQKMMNSNQSLAKILEPSENSTTQPGLTTQAQNYLPLNETQATENQIPNNNVAKNPNNLQNNMVYSNQNINETISQQPNTAIPLQKQQIYNAELNQGMSQQNSLAPQPQQIINPNTPTSTTTPNLPTVREELVLRQNKEQIQSQAPQHSQQIAPEAMIQEPIFPVDTSKQKIYHNLSHRKYTEPAYYNTLGQPVEKLPSNLYHNPIPALPQTLSPQPTNNQGKYSNVKSTESKTSLMGERQSGKVPSRSQLQQIYNQYKGSQSFTNQNVKVSEEDVTHSERNLNVKRDIPRRHNTIPVERVGGDSAGVRQLNDQRLPNVDHIKYDYIGDVGKSDKDLSQINRKYRNGLQDMVYTSYPTSAAWTFHGDGQPIGQQYASRRGRSLRYNGY